jgi:uncharacterized protein (DUF885 family)
MPSPARSVSFLSIGVCAIVLTSVVHAAPSDVQQFHRVTHAYIERYLATHPEDATQLGDHRFDRRSADVSKAGIEANRALFRGTLVALEAIPASSLPAEEAVDRDILVVDLQARLFDIEVLQTYRRRVTDYSATQGVYLLVARDYAPLAQRLAAANERLKAIPRMLAAAKQNLDNPPRVFTETAIAQNKGAIAFVRDDLDDFVKQAPSMKPILAPARARAIAALTDYGNWLEHDLLPRSNGEFRFGREHFAERLRFALDSDLSADDVLARAEANVVAIQKAMEETALPLHRRYFPDQPTDGLDRKQLVRHVLDRIAEIHPTNETVVAEAEKDLADATAFVREHRLVTVPTAPVRIIVMPEFQRGAAVAFCDSPGPLEKNGATFYAISPTPADWSPERVASQFREDNSAMLKDITVHEAMPGHYLQLAVANQAQHTTLVRSLIGSGTFVEGWAVYAEEMMALAGYGGPEAHMQQLKVRLRVAINAVLDHKLHVDGISEQDAMHLMMDVGYQEEGEAAGKWRRAQMSAGQLSTYFVGVEEVTALARDVKAQKGGDAMAVHDAMLSHGSIATKYIRRLMGLSSQT